MTSSSTPPENSAFDAQKHWDDVYASKYENTLGWYEPDFHVTLGFLRGVPLAEKRVFLAGVGLSGIAKLMGEAGASLILNDLSPLAIEALVKRDSLERFPLALAVGDLGASVPEPVILPCDLWIDRAVLHFLLEETQILAYFQRLKSSVVPGGRIMFAEFAPGGATRCSNLPVKQYSIEALQKRLGDDFEQIRHEQIEYLTPSGASRPYTFALFLRSR